MDRIYRSRLGMCGTGVPRPELTYHRGVEIPAATFAGLLLFREALDERIAMRLLRSPEGARFPVGLSDLVLDAPCEPRPARDGTIRCQPAFEGGELTNQAVFVDPDCRGAALMRAAMVRYARVPEWSCTGFRYAIAERGAQVMAPSTVYELDGAGQCHAHSPSPGDVYFSTRVVDDETFPAIAPDGRGAGRLRPVRPHAGARPDHFFDQELGVRCIPSLERCLPWPERVQYEELWRDERCTVRAPAARVFRMAACSQTPPPPYVAVFRIGDEIRTPLYASEPGGCAALDVPNMAYFEVEQVDLATFARLERVVD